MALGAVPQVRPSLGLTAKTKNQRSSLVSAPMISTLTRMGQHGNAGVAACTLERWLAQGL